MHKACLWFVACALVFAAFSAPTNALELINDPHFQAGFSVYAPNGSYEGPLQYTTAYGAPK